MSQNGVPPLQIVW